MTGKSTRTLAAFALAVAIALVVRLVLVPERHDPAVSLRQIGQALTLYSKEHGGRYPPELRALVSSGYIKASAIRSDGGTFQFFSANEPAAAVGSDAIVASEPNKLVRYNALLGDGTVIWVDENGPAAALARLHPITTRTAPTSEGRSR